MISQNVISKSGTTTEPANAFRVFRELWLRNTVKKQTNAPCNNWPPKSVLLRLKQMPTVVVDVSRPTAVAPIASGADIKVYGRCARQARKLVSPACNILYRKGFSGKLRAITSTLQKQEQLAGESGSGKRPKGIFTQLRHLNPALIIQEKEPYHVWWSVLTKPRKKRRRPDGLGYSRKVDSL